MKFPIGIQTFSEIITGGYVYVDKTDLMYKLVDEGKYYFLSRPRRFGKSLLTTTLEAYFLGQKDLFKGLAIDSLETEWIEYPVFHLDFSGETYDSPEKLNARLNYYFSQWKTKYGEVDGKNGFGNGFLELIQRASETTGKKVVILVDEYDKPLTDTIGNAEIQDANRAILQGLYGVFKNCDKFIKFTFLTGVTRYGKLGIFSAANNLKDISMDPKYASICGVSEIELHTYFNNEVNGFADEEGVGVDEMYQMLKRKYDGYHFSKKSIDIYNPFSLLNSLADKELNNYWFATGTPTYLAKILSKSDINIPDFENELMATEEMLASFGNGESNTIAAFYQSGYLTIKDYRDGCYLLGFPNEEVSEGLTRILIPSYVSSTTSDRKDLDLVKLRQLVRNDDVDGFMAQIQLIMSQIPFESNEVKLIEANFRNMLYLMLRFTGHKVFVEFSVLAGRVDVFFETKNFAYIIECKRDESAEMALSQIDEKRYAEKISAIGKRVVKIGANFSTKERNLVEWRLSNS